MQKLLARVGKPNAEISVLFVDDSRIQELNQAWRGLNKPTDVLSWPQNEVGVEEGAFDLTLGDVAISLDTAQRQADSRDWELADEVALLLVHGVLHLLGYEDETDDGAEAMRQIESDLLGKPLEKVSVSPG